MEHFWHSILRLVLISFSWLRKLAPLNLRFPEVVFSFLIHFLFFNSSTLRKIQCVFCLGSTLEHSKRTYVFYCKSEETVSINLHFFLFPPPPPLKWTVCLCVRPSVVVLFCCSRKESLEPYYFSLDWLFSRCFCLSPTELCIHSLPFHSSPVCVRSIDWRRKLCVWLLLPLLFVAESDP